MAVFSVLCVHININKLRDTFSSILSTVDLSKHLIMVESFENSYSSSILWPSVSSFPFSAIEYGWTCVSGYFREYGWTCVSGYFREMRLPSHVVSTFIMKTFVLDFIQCRTFLSESVMPSPCFIPEPVFYTQSVLLSPRFIPESVFYTQCVVRNQQSLFSTDRAENRFSLSSPWSLHR